MRDLTTRPILHMDIYCRKAHELRQTSRGRRRVVLVSDGSFEGERPNGTILPDSGDPTLVRPEGVFEPDAQFLLQTDDSALIHLHYRGMWHAPAPVQERLMNREGPVDSSENYFRTAVFFENRAENYLWLNRHLAIGVGLSKAGGIVYDVDNVL